MDDFVRGGREKGKKEGGCGDGIVEGAAGLRCFCGVFVVFFFLFWCPGADFSGAGNFGGPKL